MMTKTQGFNIAPTIVSDPPKKKAGDSHGATDQYAVSHPISNKNKSDPLHSRFQKLAKQISRTRQPMIDIDTYVQTIVSSVHEHKHKHEHKHDKTTKHNDIINDLYSAYSKPDKAETAALTQEINQIQYFANAVNKDISSMTSREIVEGMIEQEISNRSKTRSLPPVIKLLLTKVWKHVMLNIYFDIDCGKTEWEKSKNFIDLILSSVQPHRTSAEKHNLIKLIAVVSKDLKLGLQRLHCPDALQEKLLAHLRSQHLIALGKIPANTSN
jgi:hypothetical protein